MRALQGDLEDRGGMIAFNTRIERLIHTQAGWLVRYSGSETGELAVDAVVNSAGLGAQALARHTEDYPAERVPRLVLARGNYFGYAGRPVFSRLIYPAPRIDGGLGIHVTLDLAGRMRFGPDVEWIDEENYDVNAEPRGVVLRRHPPLLAGAAGRHAAARLRRHPAEADRAGRARRRFHDRRRRRSTGCRGLVHLFGIESPGLTVVAVAGRDGGRSPGELSARRSCACGGSGLLVVAGGDRLDLLRSAAPATP